jgi:hypothetical protein
MLRRYLLQSATATALQSLWRGYRVRVAGASSRPQFVGVAIAQGRAAARIRALEERNEVLIEVAKEGRTRMEAMETALRFMWDKVVVGDGDDEEAHDQGDDEDEGEVDERDFAGTYDDDIGEEGADEDFENDFFDEAERQAEAFGHEYPGDDGETY